MQRLIWTVLISFLAAIALGPMLIPWLKRMKFGQTIYDLGPESHKKKQGVPTMGGIIFMIPMIVVPLIMAQGDSRWDYLPVALISTLGFGLIGFVDDFIKVKKKRSLGLTPMQKIVPQLVLSIAFSVWAYTEPSIGSKWGGAVHDAGMGSWHLVHPDDGVRDGGHGQQRESPGRAGRPFVRLRADRLYHDGADPHAARRLRQAGSGRSGQPDEPDDLLRCRGGGAFGFPALQQPSGGRCSWATWGPLPSAARWWR